METGSRSEYGLNCEPFKSYYVVWKPHCQGRATQTKKKFKSYYVVWKLGVPSPIMYSIFSFKSYYVVWKLTPTEKKILCKLCLNRTMQYGNVVTHPYISLKNSFKSYYVVWKLGVPSPMMYSIFSFKSYYVVWKQKQTADDDWSIPGLNRTMQYGNGKGRSGVVDFLFV